MSHSFQKFKGIMYENLSHLAHFQHLGSIYLSVIMGLFKLYVFVIDWKLEFSPTGPLFFLQFPLYVSEPSEWNGIDAKEITKHLSRNFGWRCIVPSGGGHERQPWIMIHSDHFWLLSFPMVPHIVSGEDCFKRRPRSLLYTFPVK